MSEKNYRSVENYTVPFWTTMGAIFFMAFWLIASLWGFGAVIMTAAGIDLLVKVFASQARDD